MDAVPAPPINAPGIVVLDTGLVTGHPLLAPAVGDSQSFLDGASAADEHGHGTFVSGIALYDDIAASQRHRRFVPELRLFSGRVLDERNEGDPRLIENQVERAVRYFVEAYGCRVFNLSYGNVTGYGRVERSALYRSLEDCVTLWAAEAIPDRSHHFFEIPIPGAFWQDRARVRELTVALAYRPLVRTTRVDYRAAKISFKLVRAASLDEVAGWFNAAVDPDDVTKIPERATARSLSETARSKGTVQASTWSFTRPSQETRESRWFVVVTRNDPAWGQDLSSEREPYALAITLDDRSEQQLRLVEPRLYTQIEIRLRERARARARVAFP